MKQFVLFFISLFLLGVGAVRKRCIKRKFLSLLGVILSITVYFVRRWKRRDCNILWYSFCTVPVSGE